MNPQTVPKSGADSFLIGAIMGVVGTVLLAGSVSMSDAGAALFIGWLLLIAAGIFTTVGIYKGLAGINYVVKNTVQLQQALPQFHGSYEPVPGQSPQHGQHIFPPQPPMQNWQQPDQFGGEQSGQSIDPNSRNFD